MTASRWIGHGLLWLGFLGGALVAVRRTEMPDAPWATINWPHYIAAVSIAIVGVVLLRRTKRQGRAAKHEHAANVEEMVAALERLLATMNAWQTESGKLDVHQVHRRIDAELTNDLAGFADRRESLIDALGLDHYAGIMTEFAVAERAINRMWCASADGYVDEVDACRERAIVHLQAAMARMDGARAQQPASMSSVTRSVSEEDTPP